jgi:hypothetical protein
MPDTTSARAALRAEEDRRAERLVARLSALLDELTEDLRAEEAFPGGPNTDEALLARIGDLPGLNPLLTPDGADDTDDQFRAFAVALYPDLCERDAAFEVAFRVARVFTEAEQRAARDGAGDLLLLAAALAVNHRLRDSDPPAGE